MTTTRTDEFKGRDLLIEVQEKYEDALRQAVRNAEIARDHEEEIVELREENERLREALQIIYDECTNWSNDDIRDQCRWALASRTSQQPPSEGVGAP